VTLLLVGNVGWGGDGLASQFVTLLRQFFQPFGIPGSQRQTGTFAGQTQGQRFPNPAGGAGDDHDVVFESSCIHGAVSLLIKNNFRANTLYGKSLIFPLESDRDIGGWPTAKHTTNPTRHLN
jgi:hypothetical protein